MKKEYDFSKGVRGAIVPAEPGKTRITIRLDDRVLDWFRARVEEAGGGNYQTLINTALREPIGLQEEGLEAKVRRLIREELAEGAARVPAKAKVRTAKPSRTSAPRAKRTA